MLLSHEPTAAHTAHEDSHLQFNTAVITEHQLNRQTWMKLGIEDCVFSQHASSP